MMNLVEGTRCIALTGAGGKSGIMAWIGEVLAGQGLNALLTTSTRIQAHSETLLLDDMPAAEAALLLRRILDGLPTGGKCITAGKQNDDKGHTLGLPAEYLCTLSVCLPEARFVVEADGAARLPLKAHAPHEPVVPACADLVLAVAGLDALNKPWSETVHRPALALERLAGPGRPGGTAETLTPDRLVSAEDMALLLVHPAGPFRGARQARAILLNKLDCLAHESAARDVAAHIHAREPGIPCYAGSVRQRRLVRL